MHWKYQKHMPCSFAHKVVCVDDKFYKEKNLVNKYIKAILEEYEYCKKVMRKYFNKNVIMSKKEE